MSCLHTGANACLPPWGRGKLLETRCKPIRTGRPPKTRWDDPHGCRREHPYSASQRAVAAVFHGEARPARRALARLVERPRLHELIERGTGGLVTLVSAHAGTGKTVLLSSWAAAARPGRVAWLGLDRDDNWSPRFWLGVQRALGAAGAIDGSPAELGDARASARIAEALDGLDEPVVLVLEDFHEIESPIVQRELQALIDRSPSGLRLIISTRADPGLRLQRLRLTDDLTEIRAADLSFTVDECGEALEPFVEDLSDADVEVLHDRTEGWAAGIRLAALSLTSESDRTGFLRRFAGDDRAVADYLLNEILDRQPDRLREFLLRTSVPDTISAELADALTGRRDGGRVLAELAAANFLVSEHGGAETRYRYHGLLWSFCGRSSAGRGRTILRCCSGSARSGTGRSTNRYPLSGTPSPVATGSWLTRSHPRRGTWSRSSARRTPWSSARRCDGRPAPPRAARCLGEPREGERQKPNGAWRRRGELDSVLGLQVRAALASLDGDYELLERVATELVDAPPGDGFDATTRGAAQAAHALAHLGAAKSARGELGEADALLGAALDISRRAGLRTTAASVLGELALLEAGRGRLRRSAELATEAVEDAEAGDPSAAHLLAAELALGWAHLLVGRPRQRRAAPRPRCSTGRCRRGSPGSARCCCALVADTGSAWPARGTCRADRAPRPHDRPRRVAPAAGARARPRDRGGTAPGRTR